MQLYFSWSLTGLANKSSYLYSYGSFPLLELLVTNVAPTIYSLNCILAIWATSVNEIRNQKQFIWPKILTKYNNQYI